MRQGLAMLAVLVVCGMAAAQSHPHPPGLLGGILAPHGHPRPAPANAQPTPEVFLDATALGSPVTLDKNWRVGISSDPAAVLPNFDDSTWEVRNAAEYIREVPDENKPDAGPAGGRPPHNENKPGGRHGQDQQRPFVYFRLHIHLAPNHGPLAVLVELPVSRTSSVSVGNNVGPGVDLFAGGKQIQPDGPHGDDPHRYQSISRIYRIDVPAQETSFVLVARTIYIPVGYAAYTTFFASRTFVLGHPDDLNRRLELWWNRSLFERLPRLVVSILFAVLAAFLLALYFAQKGHKEYLWLALHELAQAPLGFIEVAGNAAQIDQLLFAALFLELIAISGYLYLEFLVAFLDLPHRWTARRRRWVIAPLRIAALPMLAGTGPLLMLVGHGGTVVAVLLVIVILLTLVWFVGWLLFCFITLIAATARRNFEAGLLLFPLVLTFVGILEPMVTSGMNDFTGHSYRSPLTIQAGPIPIHFASIADCVGLIAIVLIIFVRFLRIQRDQERVSSELAAARSVQELMIPQEKLQTPGFEVDSVYNPANEVGGDFYHVESTSEGGLLVVIGDVAGKGLKAAMNVSMVMGALRRITDHNPSGILASLNRVLVGGESFTTCQAALFSPNGELVIANAGHLPPYLNTQEITLPGGLPLGVIPSVNYEERRLFLHPGDRLLLLSDGVVEARQSSGELFGFERVHNLSNQTAFYIADAAKSFGQEDDITVLTVRRMAQVMAA